MDTAIKKYRKKIISDLIKWYKDSYPQEYNDAIKHAKEVRSTRANVFGSDQQKEFRFEFTIPRKLFYLIDNTFDNPRFLKEDWEANWFAKTFPEFKGSEKW